MLRYQLTLQQILSQRTSNGVMSPMWMKWRKSYSSFVDHHFAQAEGTPFTIEPLKSLVGDTGFSEFCDQLLDGTANLDSLDVPEYTKLFLKHLWHKVVEDPSADELTYEGVLKGFLSWYE